MRVAGEYSQTNSRKEKYPLLNVAGKRRHIIAGKWFGLQKTIISWLRETNVMCRISKERIKREIMEVYWFAFATLSACVSASQSGVKTTIPLYQQTIMDYTFALQTKGGFMFAL